MSLRYEVIQSIQSPPDLRAPSSGALGAGAHLLKWLQPKLADMGVDRQIEREQARMAPEIERALGGHRGVLVVAKIKESVWDGGVGMRAKALYSMFIGGVGDDQKEASRNYEASMAQPSISAVPGEGWRHAETRLMWVTNPALEKKHEKSPGHDELLSQRGRGEARAIGDGSPAVAAPSLHTLAETFREAQEQARGDIAHVSADWRAHSRIRVESPAHLLEIAKKAASSVPAAKDARVYVLRDGAVHNTVTDRDEYLVVTPRTDGYPLQLKGAVDQHFAKGAPASAMPGPSPSELPGMNMGR